MRFYEIHDGAFISEFGIGETSGIEITQERYEAIRDSFENIPEDTETHTHRLSIDIEWISVEKDKSEEATNEEALSILLGGAV